MFTDFDLSIGPGQAHPAQQGDGKFQGFTGLETQSPKVDPSFLGHKEAEAEKSEPDHKNQANHLFVQQSVHHATRECRGPSHEQAASGDAGMEEFRVPGQEGGLGIRGGVGTGGELGKTDTKGE